MLKEEVDTVRKDSIDNVQKVVKKNKNGQKNLKQENLKLLNEISESKTLLVTQKNLNDKAINIVENKCKKMVKEAIEDHDKSIKDAIDNTLNTFKADLKSNIHSDKDGNDANTNLSQKNSENLKKAKLS